MAAREMFQLLNQISALFLRNKFGRLHSIN